jgi:chorismate mutase
LSAERQTTASGPATASAADAGLEPFRRRLDELDEQIARLLGERFQTCREIALYKQAHAIAMMQPGRVAQVRARYLARGAEVRLPEDFTQALFELLIGATCKLEDELMGTDSGAPRIDGEPAAGDRAR